MNKLSKNIAKVTAAVAGVVALGTIATTTTANADSIYTVQSGDTLSGISYKLGHDLTFVGICQLVLMDIDATYRNVGGIFYANKQSILKKKNS